MGGGSRDERAEMNLSEDLRESETILCVELVPVLLLVKVWSELDGDPYTHCDFVFLLLEAICTFECSEEVYHMQTILYSTQSSVVIAYNLIVQTMWQLYPDVCTFFFLFI